MTPSDVSTAEPGSAVAVQRLLSFDAETAARGLIGWTLTVDGVGGVIVESEAYDIGDPASHSFRGPTKRNTPMFGPVGRSYVYRIYGMHWCLNFVCDAAAKGSAVLIRALEPTVGLEIMTDRRHGARFRDLCAGPGRLCQALGVTGEHTDLSLTEPPFHLTPPDREAALSIGPRIGVTKGAETLWRFGLHGSPFVSRKF